MTEDVVPEYTTEISGTTIINKYQPGKTSISVIKAWEDGNNQDGLRPTDIKVQLYADGSKQGEEVTLNAGNQWSYTWSGLDEMKSGQKISYTVKEAGKVTGYDTVISGDGEGLSQGQRQLLSIARAAVANPPVLILDEATSSIDTRTESIVQRGMDNLMKGRTVFVIAHRLSTIRNSDAIIVLEHGKIIERGDHEDLIKNKGTYYQLYTGKLELS